jgi:hypothetical protein
MPSDHLFQMAAATMALFPLDALAAHHQCTLNLWRRWARGPGREGSRFADSNLGASEQAKVRPDHRSMSIHAARDIDRISILVAGWTRRDLQVEITVGDPATFTMP